MIFTAKQLSLSAVKIVFYKLEK